MLVSGFQKLKVRDVCIVGLQVQCVELQATEKVRPLYEMRDAVVGAPNHVAVVEAQCQGALCTHVGEEPVLYATPEVADKELAIS